MQATDTSAIQRLIGRARLRMRVQWALEGAATATILAAAGALASIFAIRVEAVSPTTGILLVVASLALILVGSGLGAARRIDDELVARRIDRASNLADRLSTAIAFTRSLARGPAADGVIAGEGPAADGSTAEETHDLMVAAIKDGVRAVPRANIVAAAPIHEPRDLRAAGMFVLVSALAGGLFIQLPDRAPALYRAVPEAARPGEVITLEGKNLLAGLSAPAPGLPASASLGAPGVALRSPPERGFVPGNAHVYLGPERTLHLTVLDWRATRIEAQLPADAPIGTTTITVVIGERVLGPVPFEVLDPKDERNKPPGALDIEPDERAYIERLLARLRDQAQRDKVPELDEFAKKIEQLLDEAMQGKISKEELLDALTKAEEALSKGAEPDQAEIDKRMAELGKELAKEPVTKELGQALEKKDLEQAQKELEKLAQKLDPQALEDQQKEMKKELEKQLAEKQADPKASEQEKQELQKKLDELKQQQPLSEKDKQQLQEKLEQVAKQMAAQEQQQQDKQTQQQKKLEDQIRRLEKDKQQAKTEKEQLTAERQLQKKKDELQRLQKEQQEQQESGQREALKRLQKDLEQAAENLDQPKPDPNKKPEEQDAEEKERQQQASQKLKDAARETGKVDKDQRKQATQKKMSSQMDDLREAMRRAKQKGNKGPSDPFNKQGKNKDFQARARGQKGSGQAWKPGQGQPGGKGGQGKGQGQGQGQNGPNGQGQNGNGTEAGTGHDDNIVGDSTQKSGNTKDEDLQGTQGGKGTSRRETILSAAQKGFASVGYQKVYADYQKIVEEVMRNEKLPSSYKYYVKRYFAKIHPSAGGSPSSASGEGPAANGPAVAPSPQQDTP